MKKKFNSVQLDPNWVTGFVDAEGCFSMGIRTNKEYKVGFRLTPSFQIRLNRRDID
jgi:hypothetical protein